MAGSFGTAEISKNYPVPENTGIEADDYHKDRKISLEAEEGSNVRRRFKHGL